MVRTALAVCLALSLPAAAVAAPKGPHQPRQERDALRDDLRDEQRAGALLREFDQAAVMRDGRRLEWIEERVWRALQDETREASRETGQAARELDRSRWDVERERRELRQDAWTGDRREYHDDMRDLQVERRQAADDRRDLIDRADYRQRIQNLTNEWARLRGLRNPRWMQRKHDMLVELVELSRREIRSDMNELHEDRGEQRDQQRERWEQHREGDRGW